MPHVCKSLRYWGAPMWLKLCAKVSSFQNWVPIVHISLRNEYNCFLKKAHSGGKQRFFTFCAKISRSMPDMCHLCAWYVHILWTDYDSIKCPEAPQSSFVGQELLILFITQPIMDVFWVKLSVIEVYVDIEYNVSTNFTQKMFIMSCVKNKMRRSWPTKLFWGASGHLMEL